MAIGTITTRVAKINLDVSHNWETLPESSQAFFADYGQKQWYADAHAPCARKNYETEAAWLTDVRKRVMDRHSMAEAGTIGVTSPNKAELLRLANEAREKAEREAQASAAEVVALKAQLAAMADSKKKAA